MAKSDAPALRLIVERGPRLVPASEFDAERLDAYAYGRIIRMVPVDEADRKDIRRWWAILNRVVKDGNVPWRTATQASEAIKLALGIVNYGKTIDGKYFQTPRSLKELDDAELAQAVEAMIELVHRMTGIDPVQWDREAADVGRDIEDKPEDAPPPASGNGSGGALLPTAAAAESADEDVKEGDCPPSYLIPEMMEDCIDAMVEAATTLPDSKAAERIAELHGAYRLPENLGGYEKFVDLCAATAERIIGKPAERARAREFLRGKIEKYMNTEVSS